MATQHESITLTQANKLAIKLGVKGAIDLAQFRRGIEVELEHASTIRKYAPAARVLEFAASVALDHLNENPRYYTLHDKMGL